MDIKKAIINLSWRLHLNGVYSFKCHTNIYNFLTEQPKHLYTGLSINIYKKMVDRRNEIKNDDDNLYKLEEGLSYNRNI